VGGNWPAGSRRQRSKKRKKSREKMGCCKKETSFLNLLAGSGLHVWGKRGNDFKSWLREKGEKKKREEG